jgi:rubrerythrin
MPNLKGTQTEKNLAASFAGECMARTRYTYFAEVAKKQGYEHIAAILLETAENEREHAKIFFNLLKQKGGTAVQIPAGVPLTGIGSTAENLRAAANGEQEETDVVYPKFAEIAEKEGFKKIAQTFRLIGQVEKEHELRYKQLLKQVESGSVFKRAKALRWKCRNCGYVFEGTAAPKACPACFFPQAYFEPAPALE